MWFSRPCRGVLPRVKQVWVDHEERGENLEKKMGLTGLEPVTLRLSSACSNQLSYRPAWRPRRENFRFQIDDFPLFHRRNYLNRQTQIANRKNELVFRVVIRRVHIGKVNSPPSPRLRRDSLRSSLRRERRLEARGFEPLTSSLQSWRSTN